MTVATLRPPEAAGIGRGLTFALVAHGLLILALSAGVSWRSDTSAAFEAELWSAVPQVAAPREEAPPEPEPEAPKPKPDNQAQQRAAEEAAAEQREAEIAIAKDKKRKEEKAREEAARLERQERDKAAKDKLAKDKAAKDKATKDEQDKKKAKDEKAAKEAKEAKAADARREAQRLENLRRIQGMAGGTPNSTGTAAQNAAPSAGWKGRVVARIKPLIIYAGNRDANPTVLVRLTLGPDGRILGTRVVNASSDAEWDRAVLRAIEKAEMLPRDTDGRVPSVVELNLNPLE
jgi:colicin import membrane protein